MQGIELGVGRGRVRGPFAGAQVAPAWYVEEMSRAWAVTAAFDGPPAGPSEVNDWALGYGARVWRGRHGFRLDGAAGQFALVLPEHDLVIAYQGATLDTQATLRAFWAFVAAVETADAAGEAAGTVAAAADAVRPRDSWDARDRLTIMAEAPFDAAGPTLTDAAAGWTLTLPGVGALPVGAGWHEIVSEKQAEPAAGAPEGAAQRDKLISEAESKAAAIVAEAEGRARDELSRLESDRSTLESRISELRTFERDYRSQLRTFIEDKLKDLDVTGTSSGASPVSAS